MIILETLIFSFFNVLKVILQSFMPYKDPFDDVIEVPYSYKRIYGFFTCSKENLRYSCFKFRRKKQEFKYYKFMNTSSTFRISNQVVLKLLMWSITSKEMFSTKKFIFDPRGFMTLITLEDGYDQRKNHLQEGGNNMNLQKDSSASMEPSDE